MTTDKQSKEYIITEEQLQEFFQYFKTQKDPLLAKRAGGIISDISSRPVSTQPEGTAPDSICPKHSYCRVNNGNPEAIMHFCDGIPIEKRGKMVQALEQLIFAMHCYEQDVLDTDFPPPSKHRDMVDQAEELFVTLEEKERWLYRHDAAIAQAAREKVLEEIKTEPILTNLYWIKGRLHQALKDNICIRPEFETVTERIDEIIKFCESLRQSKEHD